MTNVATEVRYELRPGGLQTLRATKGFSVLKRIKDRVPSEVKSKSVQRAYQHPLPGAADSSSC